MIGPAAAGPLRLSILRLSTRRLSTRRLSVPGLSPIGRSLLGPALVAASILGASPVAATPGPAIDLPAGRLGDAVTLLGRQGGVSIVVDDNAVWSRRVPALRGAMPVATALRRLLAGSGAEAIAVAPGAWRVRAAAAMPRPAPPRPVAAARPALPRPGMAGGDTIVVTASKRDLRLGDFAGAAAILDGPDLAFGGPGGTGAVLSRLATVSSTYLGAGRNKLFIRGIADSSFTGPTQATVGQYFGDIRLTYNAPDPDLRLYDIGSVEVLEGPQGTLYGAGSLGGIIRTTPNAPDLGRAGGSIDGGLSATEHGAPGGDLSAMLNLPIATDRAALRIVGYGVTDGGYIDNRLTGRNDVNRTGTAGGRATLRLAPGDGWTLDLGVIAQDIRSDDSQYADRGGARLTRSSPVAEGFSATYLLGQAVIAKDWGGLHLRSSTALIRQHLSERFDATPAGGPPALFRQGNDTRLVTSETRLWQPMARRFGWVLGASYTRNSTTLDRATRTGIVEQPMTGVLNRVEEFTAYGEASLRVAPWLSATAGGRVSRTLLSGGAENVVPALTRLEALNRAAITASRSSTSYLPSLALLSSPRRGWTLYVRYQQGFRPGGLAIDGGFVRQFRNDRVETAEGGIRYGQPGRDRFDMALSLSHSLWRHIQADFADSAGLITTDNIGDGRIWSLSATAGWRPVRGLRLEAAFAFNDGRVTDPSAAFSALLQATTRSTADTLSQIPNVARYTGRIGLDWQRPIGDALMLRVNAWGRYVGTSRLGVGPVLGEAQGDYPDSAITARVGTPAKGVTIGVTNLSDSVGNRFALGTPFAIGGNQITPLRPRTLRIGFDARF